MEPISILLGLAGASFGYAGSQYLIKQKASSADKRALEKLEQAKKEAEEVKLNAEKEAIKLKDDAQKQIQWQ